MVFFEVWFATPNWQTSNTHQDYVRIRLWTWKTEEKQCAVPVIDRVDIFDHD